MVSGGIDDVVKVWAWRNDQLELRHRLEGHALGVVSVDTSFDGKCEYTFTILLWSLKFVESFFTF